MFQAFPTVMKTGLLIAAAMALPLAAIAQTFPTRPVKLVVPFAPGGTTDIMARAIAPRLSELLGQPVTVDNRSGSGGAVGSDALAKSAPDGYTIGICTIATHAINPALAPKRLYDPVRDFAPITRIGGNPNVLLVHPQAGVSSVHALIDTLKKTPGKLTYASPGNGTSLHVAGELFKDMTGTQMQHVPYRGSGPALTDLIGGQVLLMFDNLPSALPHIKAGKLTALAVTTDTRAVALPEVPTMAEAGVSGFNVASWTGLCAPARTPADVVMRLHRDTVAALESKDVKERLQAAGIEVQPMTSAAFGALVASESERWGKLVKRAGITAD